jgi:hypothetical protein
LFFNGRAPIATDIGTNKSIRRMTFMPEQPGASGFAPPKAEQTSTRRRGIALELVATGTLAVSLIVAATAVSMAERPFARGHFAASSLQITLPRP